MHGTCIKIVVFVCLICSAACVISGFCCDVDVNYALLGYYTASSGNFLPTRWDNLNF